jgi:hypothetical protein
MISIMISYNFLACSMQSEAVLVVICSNVVVVVVIIHKGQLKLQAKAATAPDLLVVQEQED